MDRRSDRIAILILTLLVTALWADVLLLGRGPFQRDLTVYHFPMKKIVRDIVSAGEFPSWNPLYSAGQPLAANPAYEVFYPPQWLIFVGSYEFGYLLHIVVHFYIAALGMYFFLRRLGCREVAAFFGAAVFVLSGPYMSLVKLLPFLFSMSWVPLIALFAHRAIHQRDWTSVALGALPVAMQALIAEPTTLLQTWSVVLLWAAWSGWRERAARGLSLALRPVARALAMLISGFLLAAVQLVPTIDFTRDSVRSVPFTFQLVSHWSMAVQRPVELLFPSYFRLQRLGSGESRLTELYPLGDPFIAELYTGLIVVILLPLFFRVAHRMKWFFVVAAGGAYLVAIGKNTPLLALLYNVGVFREIRYPEKFFLTTFVLLVIGSALLFERLLRDENERDVRIVRLSAVVWTVICLLAAITASGVRPPRPESAIEIATFGFESVSPRWYWLANVIRGAAVVTVLFIYRRFATRRLLWSTLLIAVAIAELLPLQRALAPRIDAAFFTEPPAAKNVHQQLASGRLMHAADWEWAAASPASDAIMGDGRMQPWALRNGLFPRTPAAWRIPLALEQDFDETHLLITRDLLDAMSQVRGRGQHQWVELFARMTNVSVVADFADPGAALERARVDIRAVEPIQLRSLDGNARFYFAEENVAAADRADIVAALVEQNLSPRVAFTPSPQPAARGEVETIAELSNAMSLRTRNAAASLLVAAVTRHRHWHATIDDRPVEIVPVNIAFMGVVVPAGEHVVEFHYRNPTFAVGAAVSATTALLLLCAAAVDRRRHARA